LTAELDPVYFTKTYGNALPSKNPLSKVTTDQFMSWITGRTSEEQWLLHRYKYLDVEQALIQEQNIK